MQMSYTKLFDPAATAPAPATGGHSRLADRSTNVGYIYAGDVVLAVNLALATGRPLLVRGPSGTGKSSLARDIAARTGRMLVEVHMTSRTETQDLLWQFDAIRRLQDAQINRLREDAAYVRPGPFWTAFDPASAAAQQAVFAGDDAPAPASLPTGEGAVLLIDEIDKADPDVPNNLLAVLGNLAFPVEPLGQVVTCTRAPLVVITTNEEREMPAAFLRRCIELVIAFPDAGQLEAIARAHFPDYDPATIARLAALAIETMASERSGVSTAEFLDLVQACASLGIGIGDPAFAQVIEATLAKSRAVAR
jgi:MoxR-like ATPase